MTIVLRCKAFSCGHITKEDTASENAAAHPSGSDSREAERGESAMPGTWGPPGHRNAILGSTNTDLPTSASNSFAKQYPAPVVHIRLFHNLINTSPKHHGPLFTDLNTACDRCRPSQSSLVAFSYARFLRRTQAAGMQEMTLSVTACLKPPGLRNFMQLSRGTIAILLHCSRGLGTLLR
ncbi:hypothetical protein AZA_62473 [Nitrospirillum viridazoti Y2]|nr:hypothetical protein AZA_62473 [Nitrospirillum amazonense Y2]